MIANIPLLQLIRAAYTLQLYQIVDAPSWAASDRFDISAISSQDLTGATWKPGAGYAPLQLMLQSLLADRFRLVAHNDTRDTQIYALVVEKHDGNGLRPAAAECAGACGMRLGPGTLAARRVPLPQLAELLSQVTGRVVTDKTGLTGSFDFDLQWATDHPQDQPTDAPSIFTAVREQLGLRLDSQRGSVTVLVIDALQQPSAD
jgi:uncharacterized protein (TIGR03435 family)